MCVGCWSQDATSARDFSRCLSPHGNIDVCGTCSMWTSVCMVTLGSQLYEMSLDVLKIEAKSSIFFKMEEDTLDPVVVEHRTQWDGRSLKNAFAQ